MARQKNNFSPVNSQNNNAIDVTSFVVAFEQPFTPDEVNKFVGLEQSLKKEFPSFNIMSNVSFTFKQNLNGQPVVENPSSGIPNGVLFQKFRGDGKVEWSLQVIGNQIIVNCCNYTRWDEVWEKAKKNIIRIISILENKSNKVAFICLQVMDKFIHNDIESYSYEDIFDEDSHFLNNHIKECDYFWHIHQGWFENKEKSQLNIINITTGAENGNVITLLDNNQRIIFENGMYVEAFKEKIDEVFPVLHENNKKLLKNLLSNVALERVGLS